MNVSRDRLSVIGKLIGIYREERRGNTQNSFTLKKFCDGICSINTLKNIEAGGLSRSEDVYIELLDKLDLKFGEFPIVDDEIEKLIKGILRDIEYFQIQSLLHACNRGIRLLENFKGYVYYGEFYYILKDLYNYYKSDILINEKRIYVYEGLLNNDVFVWNDVFKVLLFAKLKIECKTDLKKYYNLIEKLNLLNVNLSCLKIIVLHYYLVSEEYLEMFTMISELKCIFKQSKNFIRLIDVYNYEIIMYSYASNKGIDSVVNEVNEILKGNEIPNIKIYELYSNIASYYHHRKDYEKALEYFNLILDYYDGVFVPHLIYIADCQNHLDLPIKMPVIEKGVLSGYPIEIRMMYKYFSLDENVPDFVKQNFIIKRILPKITDDIDIDIFRFELTKLVERTGHYKSLHYFEHFLNTKLS